LPQDAHLTVGNAVEVVGKVNQDLSIKVLQATDMGTNFSASLFPLPLREPPDGWRGANGRLDYAAENAVVDATHRYKEIFYNADS
jgi:replication factor A3